MIKGLLNTFKYTWLDFETQSRYEAPGDVRVE